MLLFLRYIVIGGLAAILQFLTLALCMQFLELMYLIAASIAFITSSCFHYFSHHYYTFKITSSPSITEIRKYLTMVVINFLIAMGMTVFAVEKLHLNAYVATILVIMTTVCINFFTSKFWIFTKQG